MQQRHKIRRTNLSTVPPLTPDFSQPIPKVKINPFPERGEVEVQLRAEIRKLNSLLNAERKRHAIVEGVFVSQKKLDTQQISDLRKLIFQGIVITVSENK